MRITIKKDVFYEMIFHCLQSGPSEAYGYLSGQGEVIEAMHKMPALKGESALPDPAESFRLRRVMKESGQKPLGVFRAHAHTGRPTQVDVESSADPDVVQFIVELSPDGMPTVKAYFVHAGNAIQITIDIE